MPAPVLIIGIGNESRGDDAAAPLLLRKLDAALKTLPDAGRIELLEDFQLQIEHAADLAGRELVLFVDAGMDTPAPYSFYRIKPAIGATVFSHALPPEAVLTTYLGVYNEAPPPAFVLCVKGEQFELGEPLSPMTEQYLEAALKFLLELSEHADLASWERYSA